MTNPIPPATHSFCDEVVSMADVRPLVVHLLKVSYPAGSRGDYVHELPVLAEGDDFRVVARQYHGEPGVTLECNCDAWYAARTCQHTEAALAKVKAAQAVTA